MPPSRPLSDRSTGSVPQKVRETIRRDSKNIQEAFKDEPYAFEHWKRQQTWKRYLEPFDCWHVICNVCYPVLLVAVFAVAIGLYRELGAKQRGFPWFKPTSTAVEYGLPFNVTSFAVSLLLVFRTNESFRRWWEARRCVGRLCTGVRNLMRQAMAWIKDPDLLEAMSRWSTVLPHMMLIHCCEGHDLRSLLVDMLLPHELDYLLAQEKPTYTVGSCMTFVVDAADIHPELQYGMDVEIRACMQEFGYTDDILRQPLPTPYTRHTSRFLTIWLIWLPIAIWEVYGWATPVIAAAIAFFLLGIENIGIQIEEPFSVLPLDVLAHRLRLDINEMMDHMSVGKGVIAACRGPGKAIIPPYQHEIEPALEGRPELARPATIKAKPPSRKAAKAPSQNDDSAHNGARGEVKQDTQETNGTQPLMSHDVALSTISSTGGASHAASAPSKTPKALLNSLTRSLHLDTPRMITRTCPVDTFFERMDSSSSLGSHRSCEV